MWPSLTCKQGPGNWNLLSTPLSLVWMLCQLFPQQELFQGRSLERAMCCWDHLDWIHDCTQVRPLYKFKILAGGCGSTSHAATSTALLCKFTYLLNWSPTTWSVPPLSLAFHFPLCMGPSFQINNIINFGRLTPLSIQILFSKILYLITKRDCKLL